jgi:hypothetical protein
MSGRPAEKTLYVLINDKIGKDLAQLTPALKERVVRDVIQLLERAVTDERARCAGIARRRAEVWRRTPLASSAIAAGREEARARSNEAIVIADLIDTPASSAPVSDDGEVN